MVNLFSSSVVMMLVRTNCLHLQTVQLHEESHARVIEFGKPLQVPELRRRGWGRSHLTKCGFTEGCGPSFPTTRGIRTAIITQLHSKAPGMRKRRPVFATGGSLAAGSWPNNDSTTDLEEQRRVATSLHESAHTDYETGVSPGHIQEAARHYPQETVESGSLPWLRSLRHIVIACLAAYLFGYHLSVVNGPLGYLAADLGFGGNATIQGYVVSVFLFGAFAGCAFSSTIADGIGRRRSFQYSALPILLGTALSATAASTGAMIVGRLICGIGLGISAPVTAIYISEVSPIAQRGLFGSLCQVATCIGILGALLASIPLASNPGWWRTCFWFGAIPAVLLIAGMQFCAESPRWLAKQRRWPEAEEAVEALWGPAEVKGAMSEMRGQESGGGNEEVSWGGLFSKRYRKVVTIGGVLFGLQQLAGINAIFYFSSTIFHNAGIKSDIAASIFMGFVNLAASGIAAAFMDRIGRKKLMAWSFAGMGLAMAMQVLFQVLPPLAPWAPTASIVGTLLYVVAFAGGAGPVPALLLPEIYPGQIRAKGMAVSMCVHWVFNFAIGLTFLRLLQQLGAPVLYTFFTVICAIAVAFTQRYIVETKGRSLEEIERLMAAQ